MEMIILASGSPRRQEYFKLLGLPFCCMPAEVNEDFDEGAEPKAVAEELAIRKINKIIEIHKEKPPLWVCGADTIISLDGKIYGKPRDRQNAGQMLTAFQGRDHRVITAIALYNGRVGTIASKTVESTITFASMTPGEIEWYLNSGEWRDAAGSYKIQGLASCFISSIYGSYSSIVGLPLREFYDMLRDNGYPYGG